MASKHLSIFVGTLAAVASVVILVLLLMITGTDNYGSFASKPNTPIHQIDELEIHDLEPVINVTRSGDYN